MHTNNTATRFSPDPILGSQMPADVKVNLPKTLHTLATFEDGLTCWGNRLSVQTCTVVPDVPDLRQGLFHYW